ncbi:MAG: PQQ-dependent dehydrogenase, methanol/ethanol family [Gammaproteobacteria bacterium]|nr:PQQ-dependent dehydrogenase, methanol/ethanol family [Gammaproteobacteria bacterium]
MNSVARGISTAAILVIIIMVVAAAGWLIYSNSETPAPVAAQPEEVAVEAPAPSVGMVTDERILNAVEQESGSWIAHGIDFNERRFSPLTQVNKDTVSGLGLAWKIDLPTYLAQEATPLVVDGMMIYPTAWNVVYAVDAATGEQIWVYDPKVDRKRQSTIWTPITRGIAVYHGRVYVATVDGFLIAVDVGSGREVWRVDTIVDRDINYFISGAPRVGGGKIYIGNGGSEWGTRGYTSAYDAETGELAWRFWSVPGDPSKPFEHPEMEYAARTWKGGEWWKFGGGGNVWNSIVYDAELNQVYLGMGNAAPWARIIRSPGGGDNLFASSIVAVDADTGSMNWYYQQVPGDNWDYTTVQDMALVDMQIDGEQRKVIWQAPKAGFFYVIDRTNGEVLRAHDYATVTWASHIDMETGRPVELESGNYDKEAKWILPGPLGAHNWQAMSVDVEAGVAYIGTHDFPNYYKLDPSFEKTGIYKYDGGGSNTGNDLYVADLTEHMEAPETVGYLGAFDPVSGEYKWQKRLPFFWNGGVVATAGGLVFQGEGMGHLYAYDKDTGEQLWGFNTYTSIVSPPITYQIGDTQYVVIMTGAAGVEHYLGDTEKTATNTYGNKPQVLAFALGATGQLQEPAARPTTLPEQPLLTTDAQELRRGSLLFHGYCAACHGGLARGAGGVPDLRAMSEATRGIFNQIVLEGIYEQNGMGNFSEWLSEEDAERVLAYVMYRANADRSARAEAAAETASE